MNKIIKFLCVTLVMVVLLSGCSDAFENYEPVEQPHLYWKTIDAVVTEIPDKRHWFATTHHYYISITVYNEEYNLKKTFGEQGSGMFGVPEHWDVKKGDIVKVKLYSWVMDSTGEVVRREIQSFA